MTMLTGSITVHILIALPHGRATLPASKRGLLWRSPTRSWMVPDPAPFALIHVVGAIERGRSRGPTVRAIAAQLNRAQFCSMCSHLWHSSSVQDAHYTVDSARRSASE